MTEKINRAWVVVKDVKARKMILDEIDPKHQAKCCLCEIKITPKNLGGFGKFKDGKFHYACKQKVCAMIFVWDSLDDGMPENAKVYDLDKLMNNPTLSELKEIGYDQSHSKCPEFVPKKQPIPKPIHYRDWRFNNVRCQQAKSTDTNVTLEQSKVTCKNCLKLMKSDADKMLKRYNLHRGQKVLYPSSSYNSSHVSYQVVTVQAIDVYCGGDEYDILQVDEFEGFILPGDILTFEQVKTMLGEPDFDTDWQPETLFKMEKIK
jgi:hypothetical protein